MSVTYALRYEKSSIEFFKISVLVLIIHFDKNLSKVIELCIFEMYNTHYRHRILYTEENHKMTAQTVYAKNENIFSQCLGEFFRRPLYEDLRFYLL